MLKPLFIATLEGALNRYLALDDNLEQYLTPMAGKVIALHISSFDSNLYLCPTINSIQVLESYPGLADATLSGSLSALGLMGLSATPMRSLFKGEVRIEGDTQVARRLQRLFEKLDINLESKIARYTGDAFAQGLSKLFRGSRDWTQHTLTTFRLNLEEFLQEETRELPAKSEAELFFRDIDTCRSDCDRLDARLDRLEASLQSTSAPQ
ncbi:Ubiquinone biosynthesis protein UbiJ [Methylomonas albis]|uniref:Ubiquinone biosynthesis accessory factor UbiJ n=1 Tax=Methylomonas albis TaxID=1854563 RepID=A0ABR9D6N5_9GAMM|nr:SCP2 sterol-binding domain-containing protein [Methylomonas albis]MBD9357894.1 SCP2 sterol-binding domain-containing protein [Methylomonas albis]CAD6881228.1 Ubiquinone biosynthesis protein UbiJ [Methylomonas albis]